MTQPPKGPGALPLLLRLTMLRSRQRGAGSLAERGYSLAVALIAAFVLLLGVGALASRGQLGFVGQVFQVQNRQARDVAEAAIAQFADALNREENRYLLIADTTNWGSEGDSFNRNVCTVFDDTGTLDPTKSPANPGTFGPVDTEIFTRFTQGNGFQPLVRTPVNGQANLTRRFRVESIEYLNPNRQPFIQNSVDADGNIITGTRDLMLSGNGTALIRVTVIGQVEQNGRTSQARVAREFEVVPKCCKRSFGLQGTRKLGRDLAACELETGESGRPLFIVSLNGGGVVGSNKTPDIKDQDNKDIAQASCWAGFPDGGPEGDSALNASITPADLEDCLKGELFFGNEGARGGDGYAGVSFAPSKFDIVLPQYSQNVGYETLTVGNKDRYIFYNDDVTLAMGKGLRICELDDSGIDLGSCAPLAEGTGTDGVTRDVCYPRQEASIGETPPRPYYDVNCRLRRMDLGNATVYLDTSNVRINFFFDQPIAASEYISVGGNTELKRVHCRSKDSSDLYDTSPYGSTRCTTPIVWSDPNSPVGDFQTLCTAGGSKCGKDADNLDYYDNSELLNIYATGTGEINFPGTTEGLGFNVYAPLGDVKFNGNPDFMGRLVVDGFDGRGNISLRILNALPSGGVVTGLTDVDDLWDFRARSFTQSSGFGL